MTLEPGECFSRQESILPGSDRTPFLLSGRLRALVAEHHFFLKRGDFVTVKGPVPFRFTNGASDIGITFNLT